MDGFGIPYSLKALEVFLAVCEEGGMAPAARQLGMKQPSVSQRISELEHALGVQLFDRDIRPFTLTPAGMVLRQKAIDLIIDAASIPPLLRQLGRSKFPVLRIGLVESLSRLLSPVLSSFLIRKAHQSSLLIGHTSSNLGDLMVRKVDIIIAAANLEDVERLEKWRLVEEPYILVSARELRKTSSVNELLEELVTAPFMRFSARSASGVDVERHLRRLKIELPITIEFDTCDGIARGVQRSNGWAITTPLCAFQGDWQGSNLRYYPLPGPKFSRRLTLAARARELSTMPRELAGEIRSALRQDIRPFLNEKLSWITESLDSTFIVE